MKHKTIKSFNNIKKALTTRLKNEDGNNKVQTWENVGPKIESKTVQLEHQEMKKKSRLNSIRPSKALAIVKELWQQDKKVSMTTTKFKPRRMQGQEQ